MLYFNLVFLGMMSKCIIMYCLEGYNLKKRVMDNYLKKEAFSHLF